MRMLPIHVPKVSARNCGNWLSLDDCRLPRVLPSPTTIRQHTVFKGMITDHHSTMPRYPLPPYHRRLHLELLLKTEIAVVWDVVLEGDCLYPTGWCKDLNVYKLRHLLSKNQFTFMNFFRIIHPVKAFSTLPKLTPIPLQSQHTARRFASTMEYTRQVEPPIQLMWTP